MDAIITLIILSLIILFGALGELFFRKTGIPDVLWLIIFGFIIATFFGFNNSGAMQSIIPIFVVLTLIIILFDGGLNLKLGSVVKNSLFGAGIALLYFTLSILFVTGVTYLLHLIGIFPDWTIWFGIIMGTILGGTSSVIVIPLVNLANLDEKFKDVLSVESAFNDALCIVVVLTIINYLQQATQQSLGIIFKNIAASFAIGIVFGIAAGLIWIYLLKKLSETKEITEYFYVLTLSLLILLYVLTDYLGGSAAIAIFMFGLVLGSSELLNKLFKTEFYKLDRDILIINKQIAFLIKSFFFVLIGVLFVFVFKSFWIALIITIFLILARIITINIIPTTRNYLKQEKNLLYSFAPKGLAAGILAISVTQSGIISNASEFTTIIFSVIILSILTSTIGLMIYKYYQKKELKQLNNNAQP